VLKLHPFYVYCLTYCRAVLGSSSDYFRARVTGWEDDPHTLKGKDGRPVLVVAVEPELMQAAQAVIYLMYDGAVPAGLNGPELAQVSTQAGVMQVIADADELNFVMVRRILSQCSPGCVGWHASAAAAAAVEGFTTLRKAT
jgi:hypothetical protein